MTSYRLLLIDDDHDEHLIFSMAVAELPFDAQCTYYIRFQDVIDAYALQQQLAPDIIILGCGIPTPETGYAIEKLTQVFQHAKTTVVLYSAYKNTNTSSSNPNFAGCPFLPKLTSVAELADALRKLLHDNIRSAENYPDMGSSPDIGTNHGFTGGLA